MTVPTLQVENLETHFPTRDGIVRAVDGVSFEVAPGEILGLVGESGSGKSITGFSILGLIDPPGRIASGRILFKGEDITNAPPERLRRLRGSRMAMIFQDPMMTLNPVLRVDTQMIETVRAHEKVSEVAARWGFYQFGRFAARYRELYGERPSETLHRALSAPE